MDAKLFFYELGKVIYHIDAVYDDFAKQSGVAPTLLWILYALNDGRSHTQKELCQDWELPKSTVNTIITELKQHGYLVLEPIKGKRREMTILLTKDGQKYANLLLDGIYKKEAEVFQSLSTEDQNVLIYLKKTVDLLKR